MLISRSITLLVILPYYCSMQIHIITDIQVNMLKMKFFILTFVKKIKIIKDISFHVEKKKNYLSDEVTDHSKNVVSHLSLSRKNFNLLFDTQSFFPLFSFLCIELHKTEYNIHLFI